VYQSGGFTFAQLRSSVVKGRGRDFSIQLAKWIESSKFKRVVLLTSADAARRIDSQLNSDSKLRYLSTSGSSGIEDTLVKKMSELNLLFQELEPFVSEEIMNTTLPPFPPGTGLTRYIYNELNIRKVDVLSLVWFAYEGGSRTTFSYLNSSVFSLNDI
jgi:hypothetical protein